eukprot:681263-Amphidinium_carterae.1
MLLLTKACSLCGCSGSRAVTVNLDLHALLALYLDSQFNVESFSMELTHPLSCYENSTRQKLRHLGSDEMQMRRKIDLSGMERE